MRILADVRFTSILPRTVTRQPNSGFKGVVCIVLAMLASLPIAANADNELPVNVYLDQTSSGWATKRFDYALVAENEACRIQWNAVEENTGERFLLVRRNCKLGFS